MKVPSTQAGLLHDRLFIKAVSQLILYPHDTLDSDISCAADLLFLVHNVDKLGPHFCCRQPDEPVGCENSCFNSTSLNLSNSLYLFPR